MSAAIEPREAASLLARGEAVAVDVREPSEWHRGHIAGALHVPLDALMQRLAELPRGVRLVAVCRSGTRSWIATAALRHQGFDALNLEGGLQRWHRLGLPLEPAEGAVA